MMIGSSPGFTSPPTLTPSFLGKHCHLRLIAEAKDDHCAVDKDNSSNHVSVPVPVYSASLPTRGDSEARTVALQ